jgi:beta-lactamase class A
LYHIIVSSILYTINKYILPTIGASLFFTLGFATSSLKKSINPTVSEFRHQGNYQFVNPLLECDNSLISQGNNLDYLKKAVNEILSDQKSKNNLDFASIYYRDMNNGPWWGINEKELFSPASLIKVPLMMLYLKKSESDPTLLQTKIQYVQTTTSQQQNIIPKLTLVPDQYYTIEDLISRMIKYSDDSAYNILNSRMSASEVINVYSDLGVDISFGLTNPNGNILSVKSYASFFRILFNASYLSPTMSEKALSILSESQFVDGIVSNLPPSIKIAHKFGERVYLDTGAKQLHDCGIIYLPKKPYLLCIMTRGKDFTKLSSVIRTISSTIYQHLSQTN